MTSIKDVAKHAGVSISTASLAFNYPDRVREDTRNRIYAAMKELHYVSPAAGKRKALYDRKKKSVAVIMEKLTGPYFFELLRGISETLTLHQTEMVLFSSRESWQKHFQDMILNESYMGAIVIPQSEFDKRDLLLAIENNFPVVFCNTHRSYPGISSIRVDNHGIGEMIGNFFLKKNFKTIGLLGNCPYDCPQRVDSFIDILKRNSIEIPAKWRFHCDLSEEDSYITMNNFLKKEADFPEAIFCINDDSAIGTIEAFHANGYKCPDDVSIFGCDDINRSKYMTPALTTVSIPKLELGILAVNMLFRRLARMSPEDVILNGKLICRESCSSNCSHK